MKDELFSNVTWDRDRRIGEMTLATGKITKLEIEVPKDEPIPEAALNSVKLLIENEPAVSLKIAASVMENYKEWCESDARTPEELAQKIHLHNVTFFDEGGGELYYTAQGDMFGGHWVCAPFDASGEIGKAEMAG